jgi:outer membrane receptor protein involved in Fe transport
MNKEPHMAAARALWIHLAVASALTIAEISSGLASESGAAQSAATDTKADVKGAGKADALEEIVVTGSLISRRDLVSDTPISTIDQSSLLAAGQPTLDRAIGELPQFSAAQGQTETGDVQGATGFSGGQAYGDLRGLGSNRSLVLLDGRRLQASNPDGSVDLNTIPISMIENVEIITGGASAVYGSDAIAGVINFKLRQKFEGAQISYQHGATTHGDGGNDLASIIVGGDIGDHRGNVIVALDYSDRNVVYGRDRSFFANIRSVNIPQGGILAPSANSPTIAAVNGVLAGYPGTTPLSGSGAYPGAIGVNTGGTIFTDQFGPVQNYRGVGAPAVQLTNNGTQVSVVNGQYFALQVPLKKYNLFAKGIYSLTDHISAYSQISFMNSTARDETAPGFALSARAMTIPVALNGMANPLIPKDLLSILNSRPDPTAPFTYFKQLVELGNRVESFDYSVYQATFGLKGEIPRTDLSWDLYGSYGKNTFNNVQNDDASQAAYAAMLNGTVNYTGNSVKGSCIGWQQPGATAATQYNPFGVNGIPAACLEFAGRQNHNIGVMDEKNFVGTVQGKIAPLPAGDLRFALGADYRTDTFNYRPDINLSLADSYAYDLITPTSGATTVREVYGELLIPVLAKLPLVEDLSFDAGFRHSNYDRFGGVNTYKIDMNWQPINSIHMRGGYQRAIRAPSLGELFAPTITSQLPTGTPPSPGNPLVTGDPCDKNGFFRNGPNAAKVVALCEAQGVPAGLISNYTYGLSSIAGQSGGNVSLKPETANTYSVGGVWTPGFGSPMARTLSVSVDYFKIKIAGAVGSIALSDILQRCYNVDGSSNPTYTTANTYCQLITRDTSNGSIVLGRQLLLNLATYQTDGIDFQGDWGLDLDALGMSESAGSIHLLSLVTFTKSFEVASLPGAAPLDFAGSIGNSAVSNDIAHPHWKANTGIGYRHGPLSAGMHWRFIGGMVHQDRIVSPTATTPGVPAYNYLDLDGHWSFADHFEISAGVTNVTDKGPPLVSGTPLTTDSATYDILGRAYYVGLKAKF